MSPRPRSDVELDAELHAFVDLLTEEKVRAGMSPAAARRAALIETGGVEQVKEKVRDVRRGATLARIAQDVRFALRLLHRQRSFTAAVLLTIALCIGVNTAVFSVFHAVLLRELPFEGAERLVRIYNSYPRAGVVRGGAAVPDLFDRREHVPALEDVALVASRGVTIGESGRPERVTALAVTPSFFTLVGTPAALGGVLSEEEGEPPREVVLSWGLWQERYGGEPEVIGRSLAIDDVPHAVVGVMPRDFVFENPAVRLWMPLRFTAAERGDGGRHANNWEMIGKLRPGATIAQAQLQLHALNQANDERFPEFRDLLQQAGFTTVITGYRQDLTREVRGTLWLLQGGVLLVLLIGCVNVANLVLVRSSARRRELATRAAIGAGRGRIAAQLLTESVVLATAGGVIGVMLVWGAMPLLDIASIGNLPRSSEVTVDTVTLLAALAVSVVAGLIFGAIPVVRLLRGQLGTALRDVQRGGSASRASVGWRGVLVVAQLSLAFALLTGAGLAMVSFSRTLDVNPGFRRDGVLAARVSLPVTRYESDAARRTFGDRLLEQLRAAPELQGAALTSLLPLGGDVNASAVTAEGYVPRPDESIVAPVDSWVSDGYFETLGIELLTGRTFTVLDGPESTPVAIIDRVLAERFWPGEDPVGRRIARGAPGPEPLSFRTIVGVVESVRLLDLTGDQPIGHMYVPLAQSPTPHLVVTVRTSLPPDAATRAVHRSVAALDPDLPVFDARTMSERLSRTVGGDRLRMLLLSSFGGLALLLSAVGLYGVLAYSVAQRRQEIGIRMALGSSAPRVFTMVLRDGARLVAVGIAIGMAASAMLGVMVQSVLYDVQPLDPLVLAAVLVVLSTTAIVACAVPARRAMKVDPVVAMRAG